MNAAIRAVTRTAIYNGLKVKGIMRGYKGLITGEIVDFTSSSVSNIIQKGGTILKTARCPEFREADGRKQAYENMRQAGIDALVVIGGDGTITGAQTLAREFDVPIVALPGTIDNDLSGTDSTIGYDTALNTIMEAVDKLRDTATSHERLFFMEVMGNTAGYLALDAEVVQRLLESVTRVVVSDLAYETDLRAEACHCTNGVVRRASERKSVGQLCHLLRYLRLQFAIDQRHRASCYVVVVQNILVAKIYQHICQGIANANYSFHLFRFGLFGLGYIESIFTNSTFSLFTCLVRPSAFENGTYTISISRIPIITLR